MRARGTPRLAAQRLRAAPQRIRRDGVRAARWALGMCSARVDGCPCAMSPLDPSASRPWDSAYHGLREQRCADGGRAFPTLWGTPWE